MPRYIDADKALEDFDEWVDTTGALGKGTSYYYEARSYIEDVPTADAVEVVRCKDCLYWEKGKGYEPYCNHFGNMMSVTNADDFCSYGERKDGEENERLEERIAEVSKTIKSEAVKEFAERLKEKSYKTIRNYGLTKDVVEVCDIDNLVKEMEKGR